MCRLDMSPTARTFGNGIWIELNFRLLFPNLVHWDLFNLDLLSFFFNRYIFASFDFLEHHGHASLLLPTWRHWWAIRAWNSLTRWCVLRMPFLMWCEHFNLVIGWRSFRAFHFSCYWSLQIHCFRWVRADERILLLKRVIIAVTSGCYFPRGDLSALLCNLNLNTHHISHFLVHIVSFVSLFECIRFSWTIFSRWLDCALTTLAYVNEWLISFSLSN